MLQKKKLCGRKMRIFIYGVEIILTILKFEYIIPPLGKFINLLKKGLIYSIVRSGHVVHTLGARTRKFARFHRLSRRR